MNMTNRNRAAVAAKLMNARANHAPITMAILLAIPMMMMLGCPEETPAPAAPAKYVCENGTPAPGDAPSAGAASCAACDGGYRLSEGACVANTYMCANGEPVTEIVSDGAEGENRCGSCDIGYALAGIACEPDRDGDTVADEKDNCPDVPNVNDQAPATGGKACDTDIDDDNDGLIEIWSLEQLHNMRFDLSGASLDDEADDGAGNEGDTTGAPASEPANCDDGDANTTKTLCGYELAQSLDFDKDKDGRTWDETTLALDTDDDDNRYFDVDAGGWSPPGGVFTAIFEGNGHTIANLAIRRDQRFIGLFGQVSGGARIRNVGVTTFLADLAGSTTGVVGGLVANLGNGSIIASYASGIARGGDGVSDQVGGLVGLLNGSTGGRIIASYATGAVNGGDGANDRVGGLIGTLTSSPNLIIASYATGAVNGGDGDNEDVGGLAGQHLNGNIIASYATGAVTGGGGDGESVGGLAGLQDLQLGSPIATASYATGSVTGGPGAGNRFGGLIGFLDLGGVADSGQGYPASYGFGVVSGEDTVGASPMPAGVTSAAGLLATNTAGCTSAAYTTSAACVAEAKTAGVWTSGACAAPTGGGTSGVDYGALTTMPTCEEETKTASTWRTWNDAASQTLGAWDFGTATQAPRLRYADYDGAGDTYNCDMFPDTIPGTTTPIVCGTTLLPGQ